jgi:superfamily II DNA helicase RecQ
VVLNFDAPRSLETYLHRIGRTARAGESGVAVSLIGDEDRALLKEVVKKGRVTLKQRVVPPQVRSDAGTDLASLLLYIFNMQVAVIGNFVVVEQSPDMKKHLYCLIVTVAAAHPCAYLTHIA